MDGKSHITRGSACGVERGVGACEDERGICADGVAVRAFEVELDMVGLIVRYVFGRCIWAF
jgi:hypothetical protein